MHMFNVWIYLLNYRIAYHANNPGVGMSLEKDIDRYKLFTSDVGLFITLAFKDKKRYVYNIKKGKFE